MKILHLFGNERDFARLLEMMYDNGLCIYETHHGEKIDRGKIAEAVENEIEFRLLNSEVHEGSFNLGSIKDSTDYIMLAKSSEHGTGTISLSGNSIEMLNAVYKNMVKFIKQNYVMAQHKGFYVGPYLYSDWLAGQDKPYVWIKWKSFEARLNKEELMSILDHARALGWIVSHKYARAEEAEEAKAQDKEEKTVKGLLTALRDAGITVLEMDESVIAGKETIEAGDAIMIHFADAFLTGYRRDSMLMYTSRSEALFMYCRKSKPRKNEYQYSFLVDIRNWDDNADRGPTHIYNELFNYCKSKGYTVL